MMIIHITGCEGSKRLIVKAVRRGCTILDDVSFVKLEFNLTGNIFLSGLNKCLDSLTERCVPFSFVNNLCKLAAKLFLGFHCLTVKDQLLKLVMCCHQDRSARSFINATGFHTNNTVLNNINDTDAVLTAKLVQLCDDLGNLHCFSVECFRNTLLECHGDLSFFIRSLLRCYT